MVKLIMTVIQVSHGHPCGEKIRGVADKNPTEDVRRGFGAMRLNRGFSIPAVFLNCIEFFAKKLSAIV
jgi:hypothetical protein